MPECSNDSTVALLATMATFTSLALARWTRPKPTPVCTTESHVAWMHNDYDRIGCRGVAQTVRRFRRDQVCANGYIVPRVAEQPWLIWTRAPGANERCACIEFQLGNGTSV